jgi:hypothetical protein
MNRDYDFNENNEEFESDAHKMDEIHSNKKNMPIKTHMRKMEEIINEIKGNLNDNRKNQQATFNECRALEHKTKDKCNDITKCIMDDLYNFEKDFSRIRQNDKTETAFFDQQVKSLMQDSLKLKTNHISLESRLKQCENDVGIDYR